MRAFNTVFPAPTEIANTVEGFAMQFDEEGQGIAVVGGPFSPLRFHPVQQFEVSTQATQLAEALKAGYHSPENFVLDENGNGQFFAVQMPIDSFGLVPGNEPPRNIPLLVYTLPIQNYKVAGSLQTLSFANHYAKVHAQSVVVDPGGKGALTLTLSEADTGDELGARKLHFVSLPIENHRLQQSLKVLELPASGQLSLNGDLAGAYLFQEQQQWFV